MSASEHKIFEVFTSVFTAPGQTLLTRIGAISTAKPLVNPSTAPPTALPSATPGRGLKKIAPSKLLTIDKARPIS